MLTKILLISTIILLITLISLILYIIIKFKVFIKRNYGTSNISKFYEEYHQDTVDTPKSISSMEPVSIKDINKDFPNLNINELKSNAEKAILNVLMSIENKNTKYISGYHPKILAYVNSKISDLGNKKISYENIKFHRTAVNKYINKNKIYTIVFVTTFEYVIKEKKNEYKIQSRIKTEYTYNKDRTNKELYKLGLNCPNCGATITDEKHHKCEYCGATALDIELSPWQLNNIRED